MTRALSEWLALELLSETLVRLKSAKVLEVASRESVTLMRVQIVHLALVVVVLSNAGLDEVEVNHVRSFGVAPVHPQDGDPGLVIASFDTARVRSHVAHSLRSELQGLTTESVLVDVNDVLVRENVPAASALRHASEVGTDDKGSLREGPQREVRLLLVVVKHAIANHEHVGIVPVARASLIGGLQVHKEVRLERLPRIGGE